MKRQRATHPLYPDTMRWLPWIALLWIGCGEGEPSPPEPAPRAEVEETPPAPPAPEPPTLQLQMVNGIVCTLQPDAQTLAASCVPAEEHLECTPVASGDLAPDEGEERVFRCGLRGFTSITLAVVTRASIWTFDFAGDCEEAPAFDVRVVDAVADPPRELHVREGQCPAPGEMSLSREGIWKWRDRGMEEIAHASHGCEWQGDTTGETDTPDAPYICGGNGFELGGTASAPVVTVAEYEERTMAEPTAGPATITRRSALTWTPAAFRLMAEDQAP
jgi:hypothetical protein